jgi:PKD repeat protein
MRVLIIILILLTFFSFSRAQNVHTLTLHPGPEAGKDTYMNSAAYYTNYPHGTCRSFLATAYTYGGDYGVGRSLINFDFSSIPPNATIISAKLSLYYDPENDHGTQMDDNACFLKRIISPWDENLATWMNQPQYTDMNEVYLASSTSPYQDYPDIDVQALVEDMLAFPSESFGFSLHMIDESPYRSMIFASSDNPDSTLWPKLEIEYSACDLIDPNFYYARNDSTVYFYNNSVNSSTWNWDFGDGNYSTLQNPVHTFSGNGDYYVCLTVNNSCSDSSFCDTIKPCSAVTPLFSHNILNDTVVSFTDASSNATTWHWNFGDGNISVLQNPSHVYTEIGNFDVCLFVSNSCDSALYCEIIEICHPVVSDFKHTSLNDTLVSFTDYSVYATSWLWNFGDGSESTEQNPIHLYSENGIYVICLTASNSCGISASCDTIEICYPVQADFTYIILNDSTISFTDASTHISDWQWDFGDERFSSLQNPVHTYAASGIYTVCLTGINPCSSDMKCHQVELIPVLEPGNAGPVLVYPNPSHIGFEIKFPESLMANGLVIHDLKGHKVFERTMEPNKLEVHVPPLDEGIYLLTVKTNTQSRVYKIYAQ